MDLRIQCMCVDAAEPRKIASFWEAALGWRRTSDEDYGVCIEPPKGSAEDGVAPDILFLKVPEDKEVKNRLHLDLRPKDQAAEVARLEALGARRVDVGQFVDEDRSRLVIARIAPLEEQAPSVNTERVSHVRPASYSSRQLHAR